jgi:hypothetical protein
MTTATATPDIAYVGFLLEHLNRRADNPIAREWAGRILDARYSKNGTARAWFESHHGGTVDTLQATAHDSGDITSVWAPDARTVDATRAGGVRLDGSTREYRGLRVVGATADILIAVTAWGEDAAQVCVYVAR